MDVSANSAGVLYNVPSIARYMGLKPSQVHHQIRKGGLPTFKAGGVICSRRSDIDAWLAGLAAASRREAAGNAA